jgi:hypothetical protein
MHFCLNSSPSAKFGQIFKQDSITFWLIPTHVNMSKIFVQQSVPSKSIKSFANHYLIIYALMRSLQTATIVHPLSEHSPAE